MSPGSTTSVVRRIDGRQRGLRQWRPAWDETRVTVVVLVLAAAAWWVMLTSHPTGSFLAPTDPTIDAVPSGIAAGHHHTDDAVRGGAAGLGVGLPAEWLTAWVVMVAAMMLPPALPLLRLATRLGRRHRVHLVVAACALGFTATWMVAGVVLVIGGSLLNATAANLPWTAERPAAGAALALAGIGLYQFSSLKKACLTACRNPTALAMTSWTGARAPAIEASVLGFRFGVVCVGCCWALMALTLVAGTFATAAMVITAVVMAAERLLPRLRAVVPAAGVAVLLLAAAVGLGWIAP